MLANSLTSNNEQCKKLAFSDERLQRRMTELVVR